MVVQDNYGKSPFLMGKSTISMAIFNSKLPQIARVYGVPKVDHEHIHHMDGWGFCKEINVFRVEYSITFVLVMWFD